MAVQKIFDSVRKACSPRLWSRGVELGRSDAVSAERSDPEEITLRVHATGRLATATVTLWPGDGEWSCDCEGDDPCAHVAAAVIALKQAAQSGEPLAARKDSGRRLAYRFSRDDGRLAFARQLVGGDDGPQPLDRPLASLLGRKEGADVSATSADHEVERLLGPRARGTLGPALLADLLSALGDGAEVTLDGQPIAVDGEPLLPTAFVVDHPQGVRLYIEQDSAIAETFANGVALRAGVLRPLGEAPLPPADLEKLRRGRVFCGADEIAELVTRVLPAIAEKLPLEVRARELPRVGDQRARLALHTRAEGERLSVLAQLVYGRPPVARVVGNRLERLDTRAPLPQRTPTIEAQLTRRLYDALELRPGRPEFFAGVDAIALLERARALDCSILGDGAGAFAIAGELRPRTTITEDRLDVGFTLDGAGDAAAADANRTLQAWARGEPFVPLLAGGWARLPTDWLERHGHLVAELLAARDNNGTVAPAARPDLLRLCDALEHPPPVGLESLRALLSASPTLPEVALPADLGGELRGYQLRGVQWLSFLRRAGMGALLADDMGLGKTVQALCAIEGRTLVVAPTSVLISWTEDLARFRPTVRVSRYHGAGRALDPDADVTITSYALLRRDIERLAAERWATVVLDESQAIKNPESQVAQAAFRLRADARMALTGTPVENRLQDLWSQLHFLNPGLLGGRADFAARYADPIAAGDGDAAERLRLRIRPFVLRRRKLEVAAELPPRTEIVLRCALGERERALYQAVHAAAKRDALAALEGGGGVLGALEALLRLRQAACHPRLVREGAPDEGSAKLELLCETLEQVVGEGHRALVFSQWTSLLDLVQPALDAREIATCRLDGSTRDRAGVVTRFQDPAGPPVMLISLKAGGVGLTLTEADHVFLLDPWWNPTVEDQAADRAHRIGQRRAVLICRLVAEETVEERILELQQRKRELAKVALEGADAAAGLTRDDLLTLLA